MCIIAIVFRTNEFIDNKIVPIEFWNFSVSERKMDLNKIVSENTKKELIKFVQKQLNSKNVEIFVEYGSKAGI